ncbi:aspartate carbamoyltransferase regulatory subunit [Corallincola platygyrae]|uniref:Aspartate carbamoyltransferase regulatory chain n=1 Tax=Corallincola platygyrae TaxID=1193278 RepID=A0ABW4XUM2_9GAMM
METKMTVEAITHGTVIDHIPAGQGVRILRFFQLTDGQERITVGLNLRSKNSGVKDIIKIENTVFTAEQANQLALFAPNATVNLINNYEVVDKFRVSLPDQINAVLSCPNSNCISHDEPVDSKFYVAVKQSKVKLKCHYCEKSFSERLFKELK